MPYTGTDPNLIDLQSQITTNLNSDTSGTAGVQTQIKQVTLTLEGELNTVLAALTTVQNTLNSGASLLFTSPPLTSTSTGKPGQLAYDANFLYVCVSTNSWKRTALASW